MIQISRQLQPPLIDQVRGFLTQRDRPCGVCPEHDPRWLSVLKEALGHQPIMLVSHDGQCENCPINGYLPLALVRSRLFGRFLVSLPYLNRAGLVANDASVRAELIQQATKLAQQHDVSYLELRHDALTQNELLGAARDDKVRMVLELPDDPADVLARLKSKVRSQVNKGERSGLTIRWGGSELLSVFYEIFAINMRDLGTPVYSRKLFACILNTMGPDAELAVVSHEGKDIAAALLIHDRTVGAQPSSQVPSASSLRQYNHTNANMWMYGQLLQRAVDVGSRTFDFGRSSVDSGTFKFKKQWGAQPVPTVWQYHVRRGDINAVRPDSPKYKRRIETWQKLPVWLTRMVGPAIVRGIP